MIPFSVVWYRSDFRLHDHPALQEAIKSGLPVLPLYIHSPEDEAPFSIGKASQWWLHHSLKSLDQDLKRHGNRLVCMKGKPARIFETLIQKGAKQVFYHRRYEPALIARDTALKAFLKARVEIHSLNGSLLFEPWEIRTAGGKPYQVYTPFSKAIMLKDVPTPLPAPGNISPIRLDLPECSVESLNLLPQIAWDKDFYQIHRPGTAGAVESLQVFFQSALEQYARMRNFPADRGNSRLAAHLHFGEISPREIWHRVMAQTIRQPNLDVLPYLRQIIWREFAYHLLYHFPNTPEKPLRPQWEDFEWLPRDEKFSAWCRGRTGYPIVDAGMRELWATGQMHNRVRMITGSFLVKNLRIHWLEGARWFWDTLVDADLANNTLGWQWIAGCGADAAPYFRIFNPVLQGEKFDASGLYIRRFVPELRNLSNEYIHKPWMAPDHHLKKAGISLNQTYPLPVVDHSKAREDSLKAYARLNRQNA